MLSILKNNFIWLIVTSLKGIAQVIFIDNAVSGFIILAGITIASYSLGIVTLLSSIIGTLIGIAGGAEKESMNQGLLGYNSVLAGMALFLFLSGSDRWMIALAGAAIAAIVTAAIMYFMRQSGIPILTFPYIVTTWFLLLASYRLATFKISPDLKPQTLSNWDLDIKGEPHWLDGAVDGMGQIYFLDHNLSGVLLFIAVFWAGWRLGLYAIIGNAAALLTSYGLGGEHSLIFHGLYGYNAILTILAVSAVFKEDNRNVLLSGIVAACLTVPITASIDTWLLPYGMPALTMPFVLCTWIFLGARKVLPRI
ncbi:urea transporter [Neobacillus mesonae]|uniref:urea transporter n=1 Tax=Neobacillus mesonae TaxID=1193713 RepID=UPI00203BCC40|nr:urea transporter [Neobacillus mesonae]MCM3568015.1 urea transporter [Neobacillus mesonae]